MCADFATPTLLRDLCNPLRNLCVPASDYLPMCLTAVPFQHVPPIKPKQILIVTVSTLSAISGKTEERKTNYEISGRASVSPTVLHTFFSFTLQVSYWRTRSRPNESPPGRNSRSPQPQRQPLALLPPAPPPRRATCAKMKTRIRRYFLDSKSRVSNLLDLLGFSLANKNLSRAAHSSQNSLSVQLEKYIYINLKNMKIT